MTEGMVIRVCLADDHQLVRRGIRQILEETDDIQVLAEAGSGHEALTALETGPVDVLLLDITMPDKGGIDVLREIRDQEVPVRVLMLTMHAEDQYAARLLKAGADGYLSKDRAPEELIKAIRQVMTGKKYITDTLAQQLAAGLTQEGVSASHHLLSDREFQVFIGLAQGKTPTQLAKEMYLSVKTISTYRIRVLEKMGLSNISEMVRYALDHQLI